MPQTVLVCGGRDYDNQKTLFRTLDQVHAINSIALLIHGGANGADALAGAWARERGVPYKVYAAYWKRDGKVAGPIRNQRMLVEGEPDLVVAFPGGRGTADMLRRAKAADVLVLMIKR